MQGPCIRIKSMLIVARPFGSNGEQRSYTERSLLKVEVLTPSNHRYLTHGDLKHKGSMKSPSPYNRCKTHN